MKYQIVIFSVAKDIAVVSTLQVRSFHYYVTRSGKAQEEGVMGEISDCTIFCTNNEGIAKVLVLQENSTNWYRSSIC